MECYKAVGDSGLVTVVRDYFRIQEGDLYHSRRFARMVVLPVRYANQAAAGHGWRPCLPWSVKSQMVA